MKLFMCSFLLLCISVFIAYCFLTVVENGIKVFQRKQYKFGVPLNWTYVGVVGVENEEEISISDAFTHLEISKPIPEIVMDENF